MTGSEKSAVHDLNTCVTRNCLNTFDHKEARVEGEKLHPNDTGKRRGTSERREMVEEVVRQIDSGIFQMQSQPDWLVEKI